jgi:hypothetical protein
MKKNVISAVVIFFVTFAVLLAAHELSKSDMESIVISEANSEY